MYGNFGEKFPSNSTGIFLAPKIGTGLSCIIYKIPVNFSLSLDMKSGTSNPHKYGTENFGRFGKNGKKVIARKVLLFFRKIPTGMNRSIWVSPEFPGFPYKWKALYVCPQEWDTQWGKGVRLNNFSQLKPPLGQLYFKGHLPGPYHSSGKAPISTCKFSKLLSIHFLRELVERI